MDELDVLVEIPAGVQRDQEHVIQIKKRLCYEVQSVLGISCHVKLVGQGTIVRSEGKASRVVNRREMVTNYQM